MNKTHRILLAGLALIVPATVRASQLIYTNNVDAMPLGQMDDRTVKEHWNTRYAKGPDEGRVAVVGDAEHVYTGKALKILYPAGGNQSTPSGATWETDLVHSAEEMYLSYWVKFDEDFDWVKGGKLPGLAGMTEFPYGTNDFTCRLMWREEGRIEFYLHGFQINNSAGEEPYRLFWDDFGEHAQFTKGKWHHIELFQRLNTPGQRDGLLEGWLDGKLCCQDSDNSGVRAEGQGDTKINYFYFSTFFGGSSEPATQWQPTRDVYAYFDEFEIRTQRPVRPSVPLSFSKSEDDFKVMWSSEIGSVYRLQQSQDLIRWENVQQYVPSSNGPISVAVSPDEKQRFYRMQRLDDSL